jgi:glycosyltransferase involved in cell wall biosynthesis
MKITIVAGPFLPIPPGPAGAVEKIWSRLAQEFAIRGHSVTLISRQFGDLGNDEKLNQVRLIRRTSFSRTGSRLYDLALEMCYAAAVIPVLPKSDVIITNTVFLPILTGFVPNRVGRTVVSVERFPKGQLKWYAKCSRLRTTSQAVDLAARNQCPSIQHKIKRIPNPVDLSVFCPPQHRRDAREGTILYAGRIHPEKGLETLVAAFRLIHARFPDTRITLIGPQDVTRGGGGPKYVERLRQLGTGLPMEILPGTDNPSELAAHMRASSIFCYPSVAEQGESFPVAPLEAMATGLPCVVSRLPVFNDLLKEGCTGFTFDHKADKPWIELANKLIEIINADELRRKMEATAVAIVSRFEYGVIAEEFLQEFEVILPATNATNQPQAAF